MNTYHQEAAAWHYQELCKYRDRLSRLLIDGYAHTPKIRRITDQKWWSYSPREKSKLVSETIQDTRWWIEAEERNLAEAKAGTMVPVLQLMRGN